jgi:hypothetical protein
VGAEVDLDDMAFDECNGTYSHPCRCGHRYEVHPSCLCSLSACKQRLCAGGGPRVLTLRHDRR